MLIRFAVKADSAGVLRNVAPAGPAAFPSGPAESMGNSGGDAEFGRNGMTGTTAGEGPMRGLKGVVLGVANNRSIAYGIAKAARSAGAEIALTFQGEALEKRVRPLAAEIGAHVLGHCDVTDGATIDAVFAEAEKLWGGLDFVVHCVAFSDKDQLTGRYIETTEDNFAKSLMISCYSFTAIAQRAEKLMKNGGSMLTLTYYGAEKWMPHYNVMGVAKAALEASVRYLAADLGTQNIRVNAISAGPIKTLAASGIGDFRVILRWNELNAPMGRNVTIQDVGNAALFLLSDLGSGVTGQIQYVDGGYNTIGMVAVEAAGGAAALLQGLVDRGVVPDSES